MIDEHCSMAHTGRGKVLDPELGHGYGQMLGGWREGRADGMEEMWEI
jgi:ribosome modulation factor